MGRHLRDRSSAAALSAEEEERRIAEIRGASPEEKAAEHAELERKLAEFADLEARGVPLEEPDQVVPEGEVIDVAAGMLQRATERRLARLALPCYRAMYPDGAEPEGLESEAPREEDAIGKAACEAVEWYAEHGQLGDADYRAPCVRGLREDGCPRVRVRRKRDDARRKLALARVPEEDEKFVLSILTRQIVPLELDALRLARALARRTAASLSFDNAAEVMTGGRLRRGAVSLRGDELIVALGGNKGRGKSVSAQLLLAYEGGLYTTEHDFGRPPKAGGVDLREAIGARLLVIDQLGRAARGDSRYLLQQLEEVIDKRRAAGRRTLLVGNFTYEQILERYGDPRGDGGYENLIVDRILGHGVMVIFGGDSLREHLRDK